MRAVRPTTDLQGWEGRVLSLPFILIDGQASPRRPALGPQVSPSWVWPAAAPFVLSDLRRLHASWKLTSCEERTGLSGETLVSALHFPALLSTWFL